MDLPIECSDDVDCRVGGAVVKPLACSGLIGDLGHPLLLAGKLKAGNGAKDVEDNLPVGLDHVFCTSPWQHAFGAEVLICFVGAHIQTTWSSKICGGRVDGRPLRNSLLQLCKVDDNGV